MSDIRANNEFIIVRANVTNKTIISELVIGRVETLQQIEKHANLSTVTPSYFSNLPTSGKIEKGKMYNYGGKTVLCIQSHERTIYAPEQTPALFSFYRTETGALNWIEGEKVDIAWKRVYNLITYEAIQAHQTQSTWTPDKTIALWKVYISAEIIPVWKQPVGAIDAYAKGAKIYFPTTKDFVYESLIAANVWSPTAYPAGWKKL